MSAYEVSLDHIGYLVNLGHQLQIRGVTIGDAYQTLYLDDEHDRAYVANELIAQNRTSVAYRYREQPVPVIGNPTFRGAWTSMTNLAEFAQALQWVACYSYQSCEDPGWPTTFAWAYTERLRNELIAKVIACFATTWDYDGNPLHIPT